MLREDYEKFLYIAQNELSDRYILQNKETESEYIQFNSKIRKKGTYFPETINNSSSMFQGIFIDIFPFDYTSDDKKRAMFETKIARKLFRASRYSHIACENEILIKRLSRKLFHIIPDKFWTRINNYHNQKYNKTGTGTLTCYSYKMNYDKFLYFSREDLLPTKDIQFKNRTYRIMNNHDVYLSIMYGDYMKLPPKEKQINHCVGEIKFE